MISIKVNGEVMKTSNVALSELIHEIRGEDSFFAVAVNRLVIPGTQLGKVTLKEGDEIEVVQPVGGG